MTDKPEKPLLGSTAQVQAAAREVRQAAALRANLQRRKGQNRARQDEAAEQAAMPESPAKTPDI